MKFLYFDLKGIKLENSEFEEIEPGLSFYPTKPEKVCTGEKY